MGEFKGTRNDKGRPPGTPNRDSAQIRANFQLLIEGNLEQLADDLNSLKPYERIKIILELSRFVIPQLKATELTTSNNDKRFQPLLIQMVTENNK
jgi:hypothetical protein